MQRPTSMNWQRPSWQNEQPGYGSSPVGYDPQTMLRMQLTYLEVRMDKHETRLHDLERPRARPLLAAIKEWTPIILPVLVILGVLLGKLKWPEAFSVIRALSGAS